MDLVIEFWRRLTQLGPRLPLEWALGCGLVALALVLVAWPAVRLLATISHEAGHALVARLCGRRLSGIRVHSDTSGLTVTRGRPGGPGMVATLLAGYAAPGLVGLGLAWLVSIGHAAAALWLTVLGLAAVLVWTRNLYGLFVVALLGAGIAAASWYAQPLLLGVLASLLAWLLLWSGPRPVIELIGHRGAGSDAAQLAAITRVPGLVWCLGWLGVTVAALLGGAVLLLPDLAGLLR
ncbi:M50 family metallopeptidase [Propionicimonas paludicola]|uniref:M50 family metallopeptidase n=1 Tax=Propionicimonas paludicola TaxID=185243 RepID=UPI001FE6426D|nr:M50 family metallopeptidase [Propionicimonas paludicola]